MSTALVAISTYCSLHNVEHSFIDSLISEGIITITQNDEGEFIEEEQLHDLEIYTRWYHELGINPEGIDALRHVVEKMKHMQAEINRLRMRLQFYESE
jgi:hypothetical protein